MKKLVTILLILTLVTSCSRYGVYHKPKGFHKKTFSCQRF